MGTTAVLFLALAGVLAGWIVLTLLGAERQQQVQDFQSAHLPTALPPANSTEPANKPPPAAAPLPSATALKAK
jgi:hypothetical protein